MNGAELLAQLFDSVADPDDVTVPAEGGRIGGIVHVDETGPIAAPLQWLTKHGVPVEQVQACELVEGTLAQFHHHPPKVVLRANADLNSPENLWCIWHELAHAADHVVRGEDDTIAVTPLGIYSSKHMNLLREHQEAIIQWTPHPDLKYKTKLEELWAESVACILMDRVRVPRGLYLGLRAELLGLRLPVLPLPTEVTPEPPILEPPLLTHASYKCELLCGKEWSSNSCRFATEQEALAAGTELMGRWMLPTAKRAVPTPDRVTARFDFPTFKLILLNEKPA